MLFALEDRGRLRRGGCWFVHPFHQPSQESSQGINSLPISPSLHTYTHTKYLLLRFVHVERGQGMTA